MGDLGGWNSEPARKYDINSIPSNFLLDEHGIIIAKNLRGNKLDAALSSLEKIYNIEEPSNVKILKIQPNPFGNSTIFSFEKPLDNATITIYTMHGKEVKHIENINVNSFTLLRDELPCGVYFVNILQNNKASMSEKIMILD